MESIVTLIEKLTGQRIPFSENVERLRKFSPFPEGGIGHSQFNELLLTLGYDRVHREFFKFLCEGGESINSIEQLKAIIGEFRKKAMLLYGNIKFAFKRLSRMDEEEIRQEMLPLQKRSGVDFYKRHRPVLELKEIKPEEAYYLGYLVDRQIMEERRLREAVGRDISDLVAQEKRVQEVRRLGTENYRAYLTYDHLDVYIATSMREKYEFWAISRFIRNLFASEHLKDLNLRWFDPTQAYCINRIDKGLVEGLMVKRAACTVYHAQEGDTFGKDSELAATLAQGKPVIVYVPRLSDKDSFKSGLVALGGLLYPGEPVERVILGLLPKYYPEGAWEDARVRRRVESPEKISLDEIFDLVFVKAAAMYEARAAALKDYHPLGLQVNLSTGVANGVLVVRTIDECARLLRKVLLNELEFDIEEPPAPGEGVTILRERITGSAYRVVTEDALLTNSFWNFYLR